ncbi:MAG: hypothetical protein RLZZ71_1585 [Bacteroidota bacterium]|jgi:hypothetical protein
MTVVKTFKAGRLAFFYVLTFLKLSLEWLLFKKRSTN